MSSEASAQEGHDPGQPALWAAAAQVDPQGAEKLAHDCLHTSLHLTVSKPFPQREPEGASLWLAHPLLPKTDPFFTVWLSLGILNFKLYYWELLIVKYKPMENVSICTLSWKSFFGLKKNQLQKKLCLPLTENYKEIYVSVYKYRSRCIYLYGGLSRRIFQTCLV